MAKSNLKSGGKKAVAANFLNSIIEIEKCVQRDYENLEKAYTKSLAQIEKDLTRSTKELKKIKGQNKKLKSTPREKGKIAKVASIDINPLIKAISLLKEEKTTLKIKYKKFKSQMALIEKHDKKFQKETKNKSKMKKNKIKILKKSKLVGTNHDETKTVMQ